MTSLSPAPVPMTAEAFLAWYETRGEGVRLELLDGMTYAMSSERAVHARLKAKVFAQFDQAIARRAKPCEAFVDGMAVRVDDANVFEPDALVRCGPRLPDDAVIVEDPIIVVEVASPSTQRVDALVKLARYFRNPNIMHYLIVVPAARLVIHHRRVEARIEAESYESGTIVLDPPDIDFDIDTLFAATST